MERGEARKLRGAYFTPAPLARRLCDWAIRSRGESVLDPSCGDGAFLWEAARRGARATGVEIHAGTAARARSRVPRARVLRSDFFDYCSGTERFDAVVGNPPFIRYQDLPDRGRLARLCARAGAPLSALANAWAPFAVLASTLLRPGGRLALVVPREALFVDYGRDVFRFLRGRFRRVRVEPLDDFYFDALQKIALLTAEGAGESDAEIPTDEWRSGELSRRERSAYADVKRSFVPLSSRARVKLGVVTGDKEFFVLDELTAARWNLPARLRVPVLDQTPRGLRVRSVPNWLLRTRDDSDARAYVKFGVSRGVHLRYKCRIRTPWHRLPLGTRPDAFLTYLVYDRPRLAANDAGAWCTNTLHAVYAPEPFRLAAAFQNPVTLLGVELSGRVYGGGVLKIEPGDARRILVPPRLPPALLGERMDRSPELALQLCARWLADSGVKKSKLETILGAYLRLRDRRMVAGRKPIAGRGA